MTKLTIKHVSNKVISQKIADKLDQSMFSRLLDALNDGVYIIDDDYRLIFVNKTLRRKFGDFTAQKCHDYFRGRSLMCNECNCRRQDKQRLSSWEWNDPQAKKIFTVKGDILGRDNNCTYYVVVCRDLSTSEKMANNESILTDKIEALKKSNREKEFTLRQIISRAGNDKLQDRREIQSTINRIALPIVESLRDLSDEKSLHYLNLLFSCLKDIAISDTDEKKLYETEMSNRESQLCSMIRNEMTSRQIANILHLSEETIRAHRKTIRKKLGITSQKVRLKEFLQKTSE